MVHGVIDSTVRIPDGALRAADGIADTL